MNSFNEKIKSFAAPSKLMVGKEKATCEELENKIIEVIDYDFVKGSEGEYVVLALNDGKYVSCSTTITEFFKKVDKAGLYNDVVLNHIKMKILKKKSKKTNYNYYGFELV